MAVPRGVGRLFLCYHMDNAEDNNGNQVHKRQDFKNRHVVTSFAEACRASLAYTHYNTGIDYAQGDKALFVRIQYANQSTARKIQVCRLMLSMVWKIQTCRLMYSGTGKFPLDPAKLNYNAENCNYNADFCRFFANSAFIMPNSAF